MTRNSKPRKQYRPRQVLCEPATFSLSPDAARNLAVKDRVTIDRVLTGAGVRDDLHGVEMIAIAQIRMVRDALARPAAHRADAGELSAALGRLESAIAPAIHAIGERLASTGLIECLPDERAALADLADIAEATLTALPRRLVLDCYRACVADPVLRLEVMA